MVTDATITATSYTKANNQRFYYPLTITVVSTELFPLIGTSAKPSSGGIPVDIQAEDFSSPSAYRVQQNLSIRADNYYPTSVYNTPKNVMGTSQYVTGQAYDFDDSRYSGPIYGLNPTVSGSKAQVLVYFEKGGKFYNPYYQEWTIGTHSTTKTVKDGTNGNLVSITYPLMTSSLPLPSGVPNDVTLRPAVSIDETAGTDVDKDGYIEEFSNAGTGTYIWGFYFDTTRFPDGPIDIHYVVVDEAGNATHYKEAMYIRNKAPIISKVTLMTDLIFSHNVNDSNQPQDKDPDVQPPTGAKHTYNASTQNHKIIDTDFTGKNYRLSFKVDTIDGNTTNNFRVSAVTRGDSINATAMTVGNVYSINSPGDIDWELAGAPSGTKGLASKAGVVFVCTSRPTTGTGTVYPYTVIGSGTDLRVATGTSTPAVGTATMNFGNRWSDSNTQTTDKDFVTSSVTANRIPDASNNSGFFMIKVYDATVSGGDEADQQSDLIIMGMNLMNLDTTAPVTKIEPFYWNSINDNSTYNSQSLLATAKVGDLKGHIELEKDLPATMPGYTAGNPKVSGQISVRGTVTDNNVLHSIWVYMDGFTFTGAGTPVDNYYQIASYTPANGLVGVGQNDNDANWNNNGWKCTIESSSITQTGHSVTYRLDINTAKHTNIVALDRSLRIKSQDQALNNETQSTTQTTAGTNTNVYKLDVVPYITEISTQLTGAYGSAPSAFNRSSTGRYPVRVGETITIKGFNLMSTASNATGLLTGTQVTVGDVDITTTSSNGSVIARSGSDITVSIGTNIDSGALTVRVGTGNNAGINTVNNRNNVGTKSTVAGVTTWSVPYNREPNNVNNNELDNKRYLYVWNTGYLMHQYAGVVRSPFFRMGADGQRYMTFNTYDGNGRWRVLQNNAYQGNSNAGTPSNAYLEQLNNRFLNLTIAVDQAGSWYVGGSNQTSATNSYDINYTFIARRPPSADNHSNAAYNKRRILSMSNGNNVNENRVKTPRIYAYQGGTSGGNVNQYTYTAVNHGLNVGNYVLVSGTVRSVIYVNGNQFRLGASSAETVGQNYGASITVSRSISPSGNRDNSNVPNGWANGYYYPFAESTGFAVGNQVTGYYSSDNSTTTVYVRGVSNDGRTVQFTTTNNGNTVYAPSTSGVTLYIFSTSLRTFTATGANVSEPVTSVPVGTNSNATRIFMSYYDNNSSDNPVVFRYGTVGDTGTNNADYFGGNLGYAYNANRNTTNAGTSSHGSFPETTTNTNPTVNMEDYRQIVANNSTNHKGSDYTAVGGLSNGLPVIAWYDNSNQRLLFSYGNGTPTSNTYNANNNASIVTTTTAQWQQNAAIVDTFKGTHVDMAVDAGNNVHLAYYDVGNGGLYYAYIPYNSDTGRPNTGGANGTSIQKARVDTYLAVGTKLMINVRRETTINGTTRDVPYITYYHGSFSETKNAIRVAWQKDFSSPVPQGTNTDDTFTGAWEVMTIPVKEVPLTTEFICNGVPNPTSAQGSWVDPSLTGGQAGVDALTRGSVDLRKSIVVGYMTNNYYEGAMLKGSTSD